MKHIFKSKKAVGITSLVLATSVVLGTIAINRSKNGGVSIGVPTVNADGAYLSYDSASLVNYSSVLGRAIDFGIVTNRLEQRNHMETTYATNDFYNQKNDNCDVDLAGDAPAQFIIASISGGKARFGYTYGAKNDYQTAPSMQFVIDTTPDLASSDSFTYDAGSFKGEALYRTFSEPELNSNVNGMIQHFKDESDKMLRHVAFDGDDVFDASTGAIDFSDECYKNTTLYINVKPGSRLESAIQTTEGLNIIKDPSTVVVFNILNTDYIKLAKYKVTSDGMTMDTYTDHSGNDTEKNKNIDKYITQKIIWNVPYAKSVDYDTTAGLFLVPNPDTVGTVTTSSAGWIAAAGTTVVKGGEFHYIFHDRTEDANTPDTSFMHFAMRKAFVEEGTPADQIKNNELTNIHVGAGEYTFSIKETDSNYVPLTESGAYTDEKSTDAYGKVEFKSISETVRDVDPYNGKHRYFVITENPMAAGVDNHISKSNGEIRIDVLVTNVNGIIHYQVSSWKYADGNNLTDSGIIATNDKIDMSGTEFSLGGFYNFYNLKYAKMSVTKNVNVTGTDDFPADQKFKFALNIDGKYVQNEQGELGLTPHYFEVTRDQKIDFDHLIPGTYTIEEDPDDIQGFTFLSKEVVVGSSTMTNDQVVLGDDDNVDATLVNKYQKVDIDGKISLKIKKNVDVKFPDGMIKPGQQKDLSDFEGKEFRFTVKKGDQYVQDKNGTLGSQEHVFTINYDTSAHGPEAPENMITIYGLDKNATYTVTEIRDKNHTGDDAYVTMPGYTYTSNANDTTKTFTLKDNGQKVDILNKYDVQKGKLTVNKSFTLTNDNNANGSGTVDTTQLANLNNLKFTIQGPLGYTKTLTYEDITAGRNVLDNVPAGKYTIIEENASETSGGNYTFVRYTYVAADGTTSVADGENKTITVYNQYRENYSTTDKGNISIEKNMDGAVAPAGSVFNFTIKNSLGEYCEFDAEGNFVGFTMTKTYASLTFPAGSGYYSSREFKNIPTGSYTVEEEPTDEQKTLEGKNLKVEYMIGGSNTQSLRLGAYETKQVQVKNYYREYMLEVEKLVTGDIPYDYSQYDMEYSFVIKKGTQYVQSNGGLNGQEYVFKIKPNQKMQIPISDPGDYQVIETTTEPENSLFILTTTYSTVDGEFTVDQTNKTASVVIHNEYTYKNKGSLVVKKEVADPTNHAPAGTEFTVGVKINHTASFDVLFPDGTTQRVAFEKGVVKEFTLKDGESIEILGLYAGTEYEITESSIPAGFSFGGIAYGNTEQKITKDTQDLVTVNNTYDYQEYFSLSVEKDWDDANNQDGKRPAEVVVRLTQDGTVIDTVTLSESNNWKYTASNLPKYNGSTEHVYKWEEDAVANYTTTYSPVAPVADGTTTITNSYTTETTSATIKKDWKDFNNAAGKRPQEIEMTLSNGQTVTLNESNNWEQTITGLPKYANGVLITYSWSEESMPAGYSQTDYKQTSSATGTYTTITNSYDITIEKTTMKVTKIWDDANNQDGLRPENLSVTLRKNNSDFMTVTLNESNNWSATLDTLAKFDDQGALITYEWVEPAVTGYTSVSSGTVADRVFTNTHAPEKISLSVEKVWVDNNDQDGFRPTDITVNLMKGSTVVKTVTLNDANNWKDSVADLDKYEGGNEIAYTWEEVSVPEYTTSTTEENGVTTITNKHVPETTSVSVTKNWNDSNDQDGIRPTSINVVLKKDGQPYNTIELNEGNSWTYSRTDLPKYENGALISYSWEEVSVSEYTSTKTGDVSSTTFTNTHETQKVSLTVEKKWVDRDNMLNTRPSSVEVTLYADNVAKKTVTLDSGNSWKYTEADLPVNENGSPITYRWEETVPTGYSMSSSVDSTGLVTTITNTYDFTVERTTAKVTKAWDDNNNQDGKRPASVEVQLQQNGNAYGNVITLYDSSNWTYTESDLPKYDVDGNEYVYTWEEVSVPTGYTLSDNTTTGTETTLKNSRAPETVDLKITKKWVDADNKLSKRPDEITVNLLVDGTAARSVELKASENWTTEVTGLAKYSNGTEIVYTWEEVVPTGYTAAYTGNGTVDALITNSYDFTAVKTEASVKKSWNDANNQDGVRPASVEVKLLADGVATGDSVTLDASNNWEDKIEDLTMYKADGTPIVYTWEEEAVNGYTPSVSKSGTVTTITNTHATEETSVKVIKDWADFNDKLGKRTSFVSVDLLADGSVIDTITLDSSNSWTYEWTRLDAKQSGNDIAYTVEERVPSGYNATYSVNGTEITITNAIDTTVDKTSATVTKVWDDSSNQDGKRPATLEVKLLADGVATGDSVILSEANNWTDTIPDLTKYNTNGDEIVYTWLEQSVAGYTGSANTNGTDTTITNSYTTETVSLKITKTWSDNNDVTGNRPTTVDVELLVNGTPGRTVTLAEADGWKTEVTGLAKYSNGTEIVYEWREVVPAGYTASYTGNGTADATITNSYDFSAEKTTAKVTKVWDDSNNNDGKRPATLDVQLLQDGNAYGAVVTLDENSGWTFEKTDLPKYDADGNLYKYTWEEVSVPADYQMISNTTIGTETTITNAHKVDLTSLSVKKTWVNTGSSSAQPQSVVVELYVGTTKVGEVTLNDANGWEDKIDNLPVYENGTKIVYEWKEQVPTNYTDTYTDNGSALTTITNTYDFSTERTTAKVTKVWSDSNDQDGKRPTEVEVQLLQNGVACGSSVMLEAASGWTYEKTDLPKYDASGNEYAYTWEEVSLSSDYTQSSNVTNGTETKITNAHTPETADLKVTKVWNDFNNKFNKRPTSVKVNFLINNQVAGTIELSDLNNWSYEYTDLNVYENGTKIVYEFAEVEPTDYNATYTVSGNVTTITNTIDTSTERTTAKVTKVWNDGNNQDGKRPALLDVQLMQNGVAFGSAVTLNASGNWTYTATDLPKVDGNGNEYTYTWEEVAVPTGYTLAGNTTSGTDTTITNAYTTETVSLKITKTWSDNNNVTGNRPASVDVNLLVNGTSGRTVTLTAAEGWTTEVTGLAKYSNGRLISYTWEEVAPSNYTPAYTGNGTADATITNSYDFSSEKTTAKVTKVWNDSNNQDGKRPDTLDVQLLQNGNAYGNAVTLKATDNWTYEEANLPKYDATGTLYSYTWEEVTVPTGYTQSGNTTSGTETTITNAHTVEKTTLSVTKTWVNTGNSSAQPTSVDVDLYKGASMIGTVTLDASNNWTESLDDLPVYENGAKITYEWKEHVPAGYAATYATSGTATTITNTYDLSSEKTTAKVTKVWSDSNNQDGKRPSAVKVQLMQGNSAYGNAITLDANNNWTYEETNLPKYDASGNAYTYTWDEVNVPAGYTKSISTSGTETTITNSHTAETTAMTVKKNWVNTGNSGSQPTSVTVDLLNGSTKVGSVTLSAANNWEDKIENLPVYAAGTKITYEWKEQVPANYTDTYSGNGTASTTITNTYNFSNEKTTAKVLKVWDDDNNRDAIRPNELEVQLYQDNVACGSSVMLTAASGWTYEKTDLPKYDASGNEYAYTWKEVTVPTGYTEKSNTTSGTVTTITNAYAIAKTSVTVKKVWDNTGNSGSQPTSVVVDLYNGSIKVGSVTLDDQNNWTDSIDNLPVNENGQPITYEWKEQVPANYTASSATSGSTTTITNTFDISSEKTEATVKKDWDDSNNQDGKRPTEVTVRLLRNGTALGGDILLNDANGWEYKVENLDKHDASGNLYTYTWEEDAVAGYSASQSVSGTVTTITNKHETEKKTLTVEKIWDDANNVAGARPADIVMTLSTGGSVTLSEQNGWTASVNVPVYANGAEIAYSWSEGTMPAGYSKESCVVNGNKTTFTNKFDLSTVKTSVTVEKIWDDNNDAAGARPTELIVILSDGTQTVDQATLNDANGWKYTSNDLAKYDASGNEITYTWSEGTMPAGYALSDVSVNGADTKLTNTYTAPVQVKGSLRIEKALGADAPASAATKAYHFTVACPDGSTIPVEIVGASYVELNDLALGDYKITEDEADAKISGYDLSVLNNDAVVTLTDATQKTVTITNNYTQQSTTPNPTTPNPSTTTPSGSKTIQDASSETVPGTEPSEQPSETTTTPTPTKEIDSITIDDKPVKPEDFEKKPDGSIELKPETIDELTLGVHRMKITYTDGSTITIEFEVISSATRPGGKTVVKTGDTGSDRTPVVAFLFIIVAAAALVILRRRTKKENQNEI